MTVGVAVFGAMAGSVRLASGAACASIPTLIITAAASMTQQRGSKPDQFVGCAQPPIGFPRSRDAGTRAPRGLRHHG
jgi:hypothetical protein